MKKRHIWRILRAKRWRKMLIDAGVNSAFSPSFCVRNLDPNLTFLHIEKEGSIFL